MELVINGKGLGGLLTAPPIISDQDSYVCRTLEVPLKKADGVAISLGDKVEFHYGTDRVFYGTVEDKQTDDAGNWSLKVYDPLFLFKRYEVEHYVKNMTARQKAGELCNTLGIPVLGIAATDVVFLALHYPITSADRVINDMLTRSYRATGKPFWYRFLPGKSAFGFKLFHNAVPINSNLWAFERGVNLERVRYGESSEELYTAVRLINTEKGKTVRKVNDAAKNTFGLREYAEEVSTEEVSTMESKANEKLKKLSRVNKTCSIDAVNPDNKIPQLFSGDYIYVGDSGTGILGGYCIENITQTFVSDNLIKLSMDLRAEPRIPELEYEDADKE